MAKSEMLRILSLAAALLTLCSPGFSQYPRITDADIHQAILDATDGFTLMVVGAHPDDEDIEAVTYYRKKYGARAVVVIASRGEGGQNEIGPELYEDLAVIRSREMREAERLSGGEYYNLNFVDFGYSKRIDETYEKWGREEIRRRLVRKIRELRPHVIITNHDSTSGHSNHQAVGAQLYQAFFAAADSSLFSEQLADGLKPWQPQRLFWRVSNPNEADVILEVGERQPYSDSTYARLAAHALSQHRSQGMHFFATRIPDGPRQRPYRLVAEALDVPAIRQSGDLFSGLQNDWAAGTSLAPDVSDDLSKLRLMRDHRRLSRDLALVASSQLVSKIDSSARYGWQRQRLNDLLAMCLGLRWEIDLNRSNLVPGEKIRAEWIYAPLSDTEQAEGHLAVAPENIKVVDRRLFLYERQVYASARKFEVQPFVAVMTPSQLIVPAEITLTFPRQQTIYQEPRWQEGVRAESVFEWSGIRFRSQRTVAKKEIEVLPHVQIEAPPLPILYLRDSRPGHVEVPLKVRNNTSRQVKISIDLYHQNESVAHGIVALDSGIVKTLLLRPATASLAMDSTAILAIRHQTLSNQELRIVSYPEQCNLIPILAVVPSNLKVGVVASYDTTLSWFFRQLAIPFYFISDEDLAGGDLGDATTIVVDMRAYLVRNALRENNDKLLQWISSGGHVVTLYHKTFEWNLPSPIETALQLSPADNAKGTFAPYPLHLGSQRVTDENAMAIINEPEHVVFTFPNRIVAEDWQGWVQERGLYFPDEWDKRYHSLVEFADPNEERLGGAMLFADYEKGTYIYSALVWYRQLRIGHAGASRIFVNMLSVPLNPDRQPPLRHEIN